MVMFNINKGCISYADYENCSYCTEEYNRAHRTDAGV